jgi:hypothetical protein
LVVKYFRARVSAQKAQRREGTFAFDLWQNLQIGDVIIVKQGQEFPADVVIVDAECVQGGGRRNQQGQQSEPINNLMQQVRDNILVQYGSN